MKYQFLSVIGRPKTTKKKDVQGMVGDHQPKKNNLKKFQ